MNFIFSFDSECKTTKKLRSKSLWFSTAYHSMSIKIFKEKLNDLLMRVVYCCKTFFWMGLGFVFELFNDFHWSAKIVDNSSKRV